LDHRFIARFLLASLCTIQGFVTLAIDLGPTHATNPLWARHARFHVVWQSLGAFLLCAAEVALVCWPGPREAQRFYLAAGLTLLPLLAFLCALAGVKIYGGALSDPNGMPRARVKFLGTVHYMDMNVVAIAAALLVLSVAVILYK